MLITKKIDLGEYVIVIEYDDDGSGHLSVSVLDEGGEEIESIQLANDDENEIDPNLN